MCWGPENKLYDMAIQMPPKLRIGSSVTESKQESKEEAFTSLVKNRANYPTCPPLRLFHRPGDTVTGMLSLRCQFDYVQPSNASDVPRSCCVALLARSGRVVYHG